MNKFLCIYHGNCLDGFTAAWAVRDALGDDIEFYAASYNQPPPDVLGRDVIIVDFSYKRDVLLQMAEIAHSIVVLDHHKSAKEDLAEIWLAPDLATWRSAAWEGTLSNNACLVALFDMERSGAGIAWDYFHPYVPRPALINHVEDRDLWRFKFSDTREINMAMFSYPYDFKIWDCWINNGDETMLAGLRIEGAAINRKMQKDIGELLKVMQRRMVIDGHDVPAASLPYTFSSDAGNVMAQGELFAATYYDTAKARVFSLRSVDDGMDVSQIASKFGGGGHQHASGFQVPRDHPLAQV